MEGEGRALPAPNCLHDALGKKNAYAYYYDTATFEDVILGDHYPTAHRMDVVGNEIYTVCNTASSIIVEEDYDEQLEKKHHPKATSSPTGKRPHTLKKRYYIPSDTTAQTK